MTELDKAKKDLDQARSNYTQLIRIHESQLVAHKHLQKELEQMEIGRGDRVLDAIMVDKAENVAWAESQAVMGKKAQLDTTNDVLDALTSRIETAREKVIECKVVCFNAEADTLDEQANKRQPKTDELLDQLKEWEGCPYQPAYVKNETRSNPLSSDGSYWELGTPITVKLRKRASYYRECGEKLRKNEGYPVDIMGDGSPLFPIPEYIGAWNECQPGSI